MYEIRHFFLRAWNECPLWSAKTKCLESLPSGLMHEFGGLRTNKLNTPDSLEI